MENKFNTVKTRVEIFHSMHDSIDSDTNDLERTKAIIHDKFIRVEELMAELEKHKFCSEYHNIPSKDNPEQFYKESCLFVIWKKLKDSLDTKLEVKADGTTTTAFPPKLKLRVSCLRFYKILDKDYSLKSALKEDFEYEEKRERENFELQ